MIFLLWLLPVFTALILFLALRKKEVFKISAIFLGAVAVYSISHKEIAEYNMTSDIEWWGNYATSVHYYDDWDEEVPCRHPVYCTRYNSCCYTDDKGNCSGCVETYQCGWEHPYDVDYHPEYWSIRYDNNYESNISKNSYDYWCKLWGDNKYKVELNRDYHANDGDDMACNWNNYPETSETIITEHTYENRIIASRSVFSPEKIDSSEFRKYKLFEYPKCTSGKQDVVLGLKINQETKKLLEYINGYYGSRKEFKLFITCWTDLPEITAEKQHSYWGNLNKNEFLVCLGLNNDSTISWCKTFSWMDRPVLSIKTEQFFKDHNKLNLYQFAKWLPSAVETYWNRKHFKDFKYLKVEVTQKQYTIIFIVCVILSIIQAFVVTILIQKKHY